MMIVYLKVHYVCKSIDNSPTRGVMAEVNTELLWTTNVTPAPTTMAMYPVSHPNGYGRSVDKKQRRDLNYAHVYTMNTQQDLYLLHNLVYAMCIQSSL